MANTRPNIQPTAFIPNSPKKANHHDLAQRTYKHKQRAGRHAETAVEERQVGGDEDEGGEELEEEQSALAEGVEDGDQAVDGVEAEGGDGGDVAGGEEGGLQEEEEEEGGAEGGEGEAAVGWGCGGVVVRGVGC